MESLISKNAKRSIGNFPGIFKSRMKRINSSYKLIEFLYGRGSGADTVFSANHGKSFPWPFRHLSLALMHNTTLYCGFAWISYMSVMVCHGVGLVVRPSTKETFAISAIGNGKNNPILPELIMVSFACSKLYYFHSPLDGILVHCRVTLGIAFSIHWGGETNCRVKVHSPVCNTMILLLVQTIILHWFSKWENGAQNIQLVMADLWLWSTVHEVKWWLHDFLFVLSFPLQFLAIFHL